MYQPGRSHGPCLRPASCLPAGRPVPVDSDRRRDAQQCYRMQPPSVSPVVFDRAHDAAACAAAGCVQGHGTPTPNNDVKAIADSIEALAERLKAIEDQLRHPPAPWPPRGSRYDDGRPWCNYCKRIGHVTRQCRNRDEEQQRPVRRGAQAPERPSVPAARIAGPDIQATRQNFDTSDTETCRDKQLLNYDSDTEVYYSACEGDDTVN
ncbi:hypothetical protein HPB48_016460 [Haemaphysalis longicornis]|uniref:CCHC-type domain-containing protein n=1 Tax=Haemaphysalis longicornis TaxID=44386 RepID=A0A9J6FVT4_HAELO|nr:hypothetical protein HPB48_016460 [Haemaphysalis longicornis]